MQTKCKFPEKVLKIVSTLWSNTKAELIVDFVFSIYIVFYVRDKL